MNLDTVIAVNRFGLGARPGELDDIDGKHLRWLKDQLVGPSRLPAAFADLAKTPCRAHGVPAKRGHPGLREFVQKLNGRIQT